jgi:translation initiation factor 1A
MANFNSMKRKNQMQKRKTSTTGTTANPTTTNNTNSTNPEESFGRMRTPRKEDLEQFGLVIQLMGANQIMVLCEDGKERNIRIPGKLKKRVWVRENDIVIVKLWDFQPIKGDLAWRYMGGQVEWLKRKGLLKKLPI